MNNAIYVLQVTVMIVMVSFMRPLMIVLKLGITSNDILYCKIIFFYYYSSLLTPFAALLVLVESGGRPKRDAHREISRAKRQTRLTVTLHASSTVHRRASLSTERLAVHENFIFFFFS